MVGGGSTGWIAAAALSKQLDPRRYKITLIESSAIGTIGVGEAVIPSFVTFIRNLGINEQEFIQSTQATFKLGIEFRNWKKLDHKYFHHFGALGKTLDGHNFLQCWLKARQSGDEAPLMDYSPAAVMAGNERFYLPFKVPEHSPVADAAYAYQFDASLVGQYLRGFAEQKGVERIDARIVGVDTENCGDIKSLKLDTGTDLDGDFFIDCSGFRGILIDQTLESEFIRWNNFLPCDRAVAVQTVSTGSVPPYTTSTARDAGWTWHIPLQHRVGNGYVFSGNHCSDDEAIHTLLQSIDGETLTEPRVIPFNTGMRKQFWKNNCVALGLAGGFLEPLESTAIHLVTRGVQFLLELFPGVDDSREARQALAQEYSRRMQYDYREIRDFLVLHYCVTERDDTEFWRDCQSMQIPQSLREKLDLFKAVGKTRIAHDDLFKEPSWQAVFIGMGIMPEQYHPFVDMSDFAAIHAAMRSGREHLLEEVKALPSHQEFLSTNCPAKVP